MAALSDRQRSDATVQVRMPRQTKDMINVAAEAVGKTLSAFMIESARREAVDVLLDQRVFNLDIEASEALAEALAKPEPPTPQLRKLLAAKSPWE